MPAFVILEHTCLDGCHWDLMLREGEVLATWQVDKPPSEWGDKSLSCRKIADHRLEYLSYEGTLTKNRGEVRQVAGGEYEIMLQEAGFWEVKFLFSMIILTAY